MNDVTRVLSAIEGGDPHAAEQLLPLVYDELRQLAARPRCRSRPTSVKPAASRFVLPSFRLTMAREEGLDHLPQFIRNQRPSHGAPPCTSSDPWLLYGALFLLELLTLLEGLDNPTSLALDFAGGQMYWVHEPLPGTRSVNSSAMSPIGATFAISTWRSRRQRSATVPGAAPRFPAALPAGVDGPAAVLAPAPRGQGPRSQRVRRGGPPAGCTGARHFDRDGGTGRTPPNT
jgi:hypothetical protein